MIQACLALGLTSFQMKRNQKLPWSWARAGPCPPPTPTPRLFLRAVTGWGMCRWLPEVTGWIFGTKGNRLGKQKLGGSGIPVEK